MNQEQLNKIVAATYVAGATIIVSVAAASFIEQIRKDRAARKAYEGIVETTNQARSVFTNAQFEQIIKENDL